jgi:glycosyltransferase involved in cell wall biosynthesis
VKKPKVIILHHFMPQWRLDFFHALRSALEREGVELNVLYGRLLNANATKKDEVTLPWGTFRENHVMHTRFGDLVWQPGLDLAWQHDLVIVNQHNKLLVNHALMALRTLRRFKLGLWGHGLNLQDRSDSAGNRVKRLLMRQCDWWFAYTEGVKRIVTESGFPADRVTVVQNAIDTAGLAKAYRELPAGTGARVRQELGIGDGPVGIYCGGMYPEKRLPFLLEACQALRQREPGFHAIIIGDGPDAGIVHSFAADHPWVHCVGPQFGNARVPFFAAADLFLMPGLVGLAILDSFALETPMVTTSYPYHSPEIEYLVNGENGCITPDDLTAYVDRVAALFHSPAEREMLRQGCRAAYPHYSLEEMVNRFAGGITSALGHTADREEERESRA